MPRTTLNGVALVEGGRTGIVEGIRYFPPESARRDLFQELAKANRLPNITS